MNEEKAMSEKEEEPKQCDFCDRECLLVDHMSGLNNLCCICREFEEWKYCKKCKKEKEDQEIKPSLLEEPLTYTDNRNISLEQSEKRRLFSSGETFDIVIGKEEKEK